jgi:ribosome-associated toxin RatA of RatAB toxin-antitoxin module
LTEIKRSALVMHSAQAMFDLVNDVSNYPSFMDGCYGVEVFEHSDLTMLARLFKKGRSKSEPNDTQSLAGALAHKNDIGRWTFQNLSR